jgi:hypothetical protein
MEKMYAIADDARGQFIEQRVHALRLDNQWTSINVFQADLDFAAQGLDGPTVAWTDRPAWPQEQVQVRERDDPHVDLAHTIDDGDDAVPDRLIAPGNAERSIDPTAENESGSGQRIFDDSPIPAMRPGEDEFRVERTVCGRHRKTCSGVKLEGCVDAHRAGTKS